MPQDNIEVCPVCGVKILKVPGLGKDKVMFSIGPSGTRAILWARVCQYTQKPGCINRDRDAIGDTKPGGYHESED